MKCPGQDMQYWNPDAIFEVDCPQCHKSVEFYKDDPSRRCHHCGHRFVNPKMDFGCAAYCPFAEQCIGTLPEEFSGAREALLKDKVAVEVKRMLGNDFRRIGHISRLARYAEKLATTEQCPLAVILCAAYLNLSSDSTAAPQPADLAREVLTRLQADQAMIEQVCSLLSSQDDRPELQHGRQILREATQLASLEPAIKEQSPELENLVQHAERVIVSDEGRSLLHQLLTPGK